MKPSRWKAFLSYLMELHVESVSSSYNPHLYVSLQRGRYQLSTANAVYSFGDLYSNFLRTFQALDLDGMDVREVLLLGLGLGSIPYMLEKTFRKEYHYTAVEVDEEVIYLAGKYGLDQLQSNMELICADAFVYAEQSENRFDLICMDIFLDDVIPEVFEQKSFLQNLKRLLLPGGILLYNRLTATRPDREASRAFYEDAFLPVFAEGTYLDVGQNWMLISRKDCLKNPRDL